jgi:hypothetical protein
LAGYSHKVEHGNMHSSLDFGHLKVSTTQMGDFMNTFEVKMNWCVLPAISKPLVYAKFPHKAFIHLRLGIVILYSLQSPSTAQASQPRPFCGMLDVVFVLTNSLPESSIRLRSSFA